MLPDRVSNPGPLTYESSALPIALRGPAKFCGNLLESPRQMSTRFVRWTKTTLLSLLLSFIQRQIVYTVKVIGNKHCCYNEGPLYRLATSNRI